jgi:hypothetical protein
VIAEPGAVREPGAVIDPVATDRTAARQIRIDGHGSLRFFTRRPDAAAVLGGVELAGAGELILHNDCEVAQEQCRGRGQLSNNNEIHGQSSTVCGRLLQAGAVYVLRITPE